MNIPTVDMPSSLTLCAVLGFINDTNKLLGRLGVVEKQLAFGHAMHRGNVTTHCMAIHALVDGLIVKFV